jgi:hypothetical protein
LTRKWSQPDRTGDLLLAKLGRNSTAAFAVIASPKICASAG